MTELGLRPIRTALVSVSDKSNLKVLTYALNRRGVRFISTGGTAKALKDLGCGVQLVEDLTGFPEMMDGRLKTLHPKVHGGLLGKRDDPAHVAAMKKHGIEPVDLLVVNLYPFEETVAKADVTLSEAIEQVDIGGPAMVRSAAKNFNDVTVLVHPSQYAHLSSELDQNNGATTARFRHKRMVEAFEHIARYDAVIARHFVNQYNQGAPAS